MWNNFCEISGSLLLAGDLLCTKLHWFIQIWGFSAGELLSDEWIDTAEKNMLQQLVFLYCFLLQTIIAGWDEFECQRVFHFLCEVTNLLHKIEAVVTSGKPGMGLKLTLFQNVINRGLDLSPQNI